MKFSFRKYSSTLAGVLITLCLTLGITVVIVLGYFYVYLPSLTNHGESITVPSIEGMPISQLEDFLVTRNLRYEVNDSAYSDEYPPLTVLKQYPHAGSKVKEGRKIYITANMINPPTVPMPNLIDGSLVNAEAVLRSNDLKLGRKETVPGPFLQLVTKMKLNGQEVKPGDRVPKGSVIDLVVQDGGKPNFRMRNIIGASFDEVQVSLLAMDLTVGRVNLVSDTTRAQNIVVLRQKPEPGDIVWVGDNVELWIGEEGTRLDAADSLDLLAPLDLIEN